MKIFLLLCLFLPSIYGKPQIEVFTCQQPQSTECLFDNVIIEDDGIFLPKSHNDRIITKVTFKSSVVPTLSSVICDQFPNLQVLDVRHSSLRKILEGALDGCTKLREIYLQDNWLKELPENSFHKNSHLEQIYLNSNNLTEIPLELFKGLRSLQKIDLCANRLSRLPAVIFDDLISMESLELLSNPLLSLEIEEMYVEMPKLKYTLFDDLDLPCSRAAEVTNFLSQNNIYNSYQGSYSDNHSRSQSEIQRKRIYVASSAGNYYCINDEQHEREVYIRETLPKILNECGLQKNI
ncbi:toll-like receptor 3 [Culicoides brevitarsis]|uniref:toll-like receptor 3 n=1 Tax=Culicoides brevitarsis TaxID=469753 RepID=UPI00307C3ECA